MKTIKVLLFKDYIYESALNNDEFWYIHVGLHASLVMDASLLDA